jgi:hypothetical protein
MKFIPEKVVNPKNVAQKIREKKGDVNDLKKILRDLDNSKKRITDSKTKKTK